MSDRIEDGGPAYPTLGNVGYNSDWLSDEGMSLRDWFAGQALPAVIAATSAGTHDTISDKPDGTTITEALAIDAYRLADALLAARKGGQS